jgi:hypothetical protein
MANADSKLDKSYGVSVADREVCAVSTGRAASGASQTRDLYDHESDDDIYENNYGDDNMMEGGPGSYPVENRSYSYSSFMRGGLSTEIRSPGSLKAAASAVVATTPRALINTLGINQRDVFIMTHDSATSSLNKNNISRDDSGYDIKNSLLRSTFRTALKLDFVVRAALNLAITQYQTDNNFIYHQALRGVRGFDLRLYCPAMNPSRIKYQHGTIVWDVGLLDSLQLFYDQYKRDMEKPDARERIRGPYLFRLSHLKGPFADDSRLLTQMCTAIKMLFGNSLFTRGLIDNRTPFIELDNDNYKITPFMFVLDVNGPNRETNIKNRLDLKNRFNWLHFSNEMYDDDYAKVVESGVKMTESSVLTYVTARITSPVTRNRINQIQCHFQPSNTKPGDLILGKSINLREVTEDAQINQKIARIIGSGNNYWPRIFSFDFV